MDCLSRNKYFSYIKMKYMKFTVIILSSIYAHILQVSENKEHYYTQKILNNFITSTPFSTKKFEDKVKITSCKNIVV